MPTDLRFPREAWLLVAAGLAWLGAASASGWIGYLLALVPGTLLLSSGVTLLLALGEARLRDLGALGGVIGVLLAVPGIFAWGFWESTGLAILSAAAVWAAGAHTLRTAELTGEVEPPERTVALAFEVAADHAVRGAMLITLPLPPASEHGRMARELREAEALFGARGWLAEPARYHAVPPAFERVVSTRRRAAGMDFEELRAESAYAPDEAEPGRERWLANAANRLAWAWALRQRDPARPWLVCIHGYQMGWPQADLTAFRASWLFHALGLNVLFPILPLHGPRRAGAVSGHGVLGPDFVDTTHALAQALWDVRRWLGWLRAQGTPRIDCYGLSLGGGVAALLASLDPAVTSVVAGIPAVDFPGLVWHHAASFERTRIERAGLSLELARRALRPVSPLALAPLVPQARRFVFAAPDDLFVPASQVRELCRHWEEPRSAWFPGAHVTFRAHAEVAQIVREATQTTSSTGSQPSPPATSTSVA
jgi:dienelactone hydrolase